MKKILLLFFVSIFTASIFAQKDKSKYMIPNTNHKTPCIAYKITSKQIEASTYEYKLIDNPAYLKQEAEEDTLYNEINRINKKILTDDVEQYLQTAKTNLELAINSKRNTKYLKTAKYYLDLSGISFKQDIKGKDDITSVQAHKNIERINQLILDNVQLKKDLQLKREKYSNLSRKSMFYKLPKTIYEYVITGKTSRTILLVDTVPSVLASSDEYYLPYDSISYCLLHDNYLQFRRNELVPYDTIRNYTVNNSEIHKVEYEYLNKFDPVYNSKKEYLFINGVTKEMYYTKDNLLGSCAVDKSFYELSNFVVKSGGEIYISDNYYIVEHNGSKCLLTPIVYTELKKNDISIVSKMSNSVKQHKVYKDEASLLADEMAKYLSAYRSRLLTAEQREKWKVATLKCDKLLIKMSNLPFANEREYYDQTSEENKTGNKFSTIVDINILSKNLLGL